MPTKTDTGSLFTIGYGDRPWSDFLERLQSHGIRYVADVRSKPTSRQREFDQQPLEDLLEHHGIRYVFLGHALGGRPNDPSCYDEEGRVDYARCRERPIFVQGLARLEDAHRGGHRVAIMCSELDAERCHRSKMIGEALLAKGIEVRHIGRDGKLASQDQVIENIVGPQLSLFGTPRTFLSEGRYSVAGKK